MLRDHPVNRRNKELTVLLRPCAGRSSRNGHVVSLQRAAEELHGLIHGARDVLRVVPEIMRFRRSRPKDVLKSVVRHRQDFEDASQAGGPHLVFLIITTSETTVPRTIARRLSSATSNAETRPESNVVSFLGCRPSAEADQMLSTPPASRRA